MRWAATRMGATVGAILLLMVVGQDLATAKGPGPVAQYGMVPTIPLGEEQENNSLPEFDWLDDEYEQPVCVATSYETAYEELGQTMSPCRQGTNGCRCDCPRCRHGSRLYVAGIVGASFATLTVDAPPSATDALFTSGGALGIEFASPWRLEFEGRARDPISTVQEATGSTTTFAATGGWSAMVNLWRDVELTDRLSIYAGGGVGGGGYRFTLSGEIPPPDDITLAGASIVNSFAWQAGSGLCYAVTDRITLDLGYRFFALTGGNVNILQSVSGVPYGTFPVSTGFSASELFFAFRVYEPFRMFRR